jgi:hypothetical protein
MSSYPLSEKAKGKQRAIEPLDRERSTSSLQEIKPAEDERPSRDLVVRFTEGFPDLTVTVEKEDFVRDVKRKVRTVFLRTGPWVIGTPTANVSVPADSRGSS